MAARHFGLVKIEADDCPSSTKNTRMFEQNFQTALLLSLLHRKLLNQWQFEKCLDELDKGHQNLPEF